MTDGDTGRTDEVDEGPGVAGSDVEVLAGGDVVARLVAASAEAVDVVVGDVEPDAAEAAVTGGAEEMADPASAGPHPARRDARRTPKLAAAYWR